MQHSLKAHKISIRKKGFIHDLGCIWRKGFAIESSEREFSSRGIRLGLSRVQQVLCIMRGVVTSMLCEAKLVIVRCITGGVVTNVSCKATLVIGASFLIMSKIVLQI